MKISIFLVFAIFGVVSKWAAKAFADGKISIQEGIELVVELAEVLGIPLDWDVPEVVLEATKDIREAHDALGRDSPEPEDTVDTAGLKQ